MYQKLYFFLVFMAIIIFASCRKDVYDSEALGRDYFIDNIPEGFNWATTSQINIKISPSDKYDSRYLYTIEVFDKNPLTDSSACLLTKGWCTKQEPLQKNMIVPDSQKKLFVRQTTPGGRRSILELSIENKQVSGSFSPSDPAIFSSKSDLSRSQEKIPESVPDNAKEITTQGDITLVRNNDYVINGTYKGKITFPAEGNCSLYINSTWINTSSDWETTIIQNNSNIYIMEGGKLITEKGKCNFQCSNNAVIAVAHGGQLGNTNENNVSIQFQTDGSLLNDGELYCNEIIAARSGSHIINNGKFYAKKVSTQGVAYIFDNQCYANVDELDLYNGSELNIASYCSLICKNLTLSANSDINMYDLSLLQAKTITVKDKVCHLKGKGKEFALVRMEELECQWTERPSIIFMQNLYVGCKKYPNPNFYQMLAVYEDTASGATIEIKTSECSQGNDFQPEVPEQPEFPKEITLTKSYTFASEDNYPSPGDFDMNDLIISIDSISYNYKQKDEITDLTWHMTLRAVGATRPLGAAIQLDEIEYSNVKKVSYSKPLPLNSFITNSNGTESKQKYAVIMLFDNAHLALGSSSAKIINTVNNLPQLIYNLPFYSFDVKIEFISAVEEDDIDISKMNYFTIIGFKTPRTEIHLSQYAHTDLSNAPAKLQEVTKDYMWTIQIPGEFKYSHEWVSILETYPDFKSWVQSGGESNKEWYNNPVETNLYQRK